MTFGLTKASHLTSRHFSLVMYSPESKSARYDVIEMSECQQKPPLDEVDAVALINARKHIQAVV